MSTIKTPVRIHRQFYAMPVFRSPLEVSVFLFLLSDADGIDQIRTLGDGVRRPVLRGEVVTSDAALAKGFGMTVEKIRDLIGRLVAEGTVSRREVGTESILKFLQYDDCQSPDWAPKKPAARG